MKIILKQDVPNLGGAGDIVDVADGYGNNYLLPRTLADAEAVKARLERKPVQISAKAGEDGTLFGSVGNTAVATAVQEQLGVPIDRRRIHLERPFKHLGTHDVDVRVHPEVLATIS